MCSIPTRFPEGHLWLPCIAIEITGGRMPGQQSRGVM